LSKILPRQTALTAPPAALPGHHRARRLRQGSLWPKCHQTHAIQIDRNSPVGPAGVEFEPGFVRCRPGNDGVALLDISDHLAPDHLSHPPPVGADIHTRPYLKQPDRKPATKTWRRILN